MYKKEMSFLDEIMAGASLFIASKPPTQREKARVEVLVSAGVLWHRMLEDYDDTDKVLLVTKTLEAVRYTRPEQGIYEEVQS